MIWESAVEEDTTSDLNMKGAAAIHMGDGRFLRAEWVYWEVCRPCHPEQAEGASRDLRTNFLLGRNHTA